ncbi:4'-phosphopantetheinyl transferase family protein [Polaromonas sp. YR568]|uniref:4'-phosphopantetheinyl transferase family protein n=1 Tax=Polaromonas sp. YR568 TaxID=1855301 RepID=UPI00398BCF16
MLAFARDAEIGCDIEKKRAPRRHTRNEPGGTAPEEAEAIGALHGRDAEDAFFRHWVRKEAALKAMGTGFRAEPGRPDSWWNCVTYGGGRQMSPANCDNSGLLFCAAGPGLRQNRPGEPSGAAISLQLQTK